MGFENKIRSIRPDVGHSEKSNVDAPKNEKDIPSSEQKKEANNPADAKEKTAIENTTKTVEATDTIKPENYVQKNMFDEELGETEKKSITEAEKSNLENENQNPTKKIENLKGDLVDKNKNNKPEEYFEKTEDLFEELDSLPEDDPKKINFKNNIDKRLDAIEKKIDLIQNSKDAPKEFGMTKEEFEKIKDIILSKLSKMKGIAENIKEEGGIEKKDEKKDKEKLDVEKDPGLVKQILENSTKAYESISYVDNIADLQKINEKGVNSTNEAEFSSVSSKISSNLESSSKKITSLKNSLDNINLLGIEEQGDKLRVSRDKLADSLNDPDMDITTKSRMQVQLKELNEKIDDLNETILLKNKLEAQIKRIENELDGLIEQLETPKTSENPNPEKSSFENSANTQKQNLKETLKNLQP